MSLFSGSFLSGSVLREKQANTFNKGLQYICYIGFHSSILSFSIGLQRKTGCSDHFSGCSQLMSKQQMHLCLASLILTRSEWLNIYNANRTVEAHPNFTVCKSSGPGPPRSLCFIDILGSCSLMGRYGQINLVLLGASCCGLRSHGWRLLSILDAHGYWENFCKTRAFSCILLGNVASCLYTVDG